MKKNVQRIGFILGWFALIAQFVLIIQHRQSSIFETVLRYFSFFTILTNLLVALFFTAALFHLTSPFFRFLQKNSSQTVITSFIFIVGLVYQIALRSVWQPTGLQRIVDELLHSLIPLLVLVYWYAYTPATRIKVAPLIRWLCYPLSYLVLILIRGYFSGYYPYPFLNVNTQGSKAVSLAIFIIFMVMLGVLFGLAFAKQKIHQSGQN